MKFVITGGGTGGHVTPALAIGEALLELHPNDEIIFIGRRDGNENRAVIKAGIELLEIDVAGIQRRLTFRNVKNVLTAIRSVNDVKKILQKFRPDCVIGTGGYVCWPVIRAAQKLEIPTFIHESNAYPGLVTRLVGRKCSAVFLNFEKAAQNLRKCKVHVVGNPIRKSMGLVGRTEARSALDINNGQFLITSFGGSGGSRTINDCVTEMMSSYGSGKKIRHIHATGIKYYDAYKNISIPGCTILPYIDNMPILLAASDMVICRCGAMTLSEIASNNVAAILIPSPNVANNHQYQNGKMIADAGGAILLEEKELTPAKLKACVDRIMKNTVTRHKMTKCLEKFANRDAAHKICYIILEQLGQ